MSSISNDIIELHNYIHYILRSIYYNYINTATGIALSRLVVIVLFVSVFRHYDLFVFFLIIVIILEISSYTPPPNHNHNSSWLGIWPEIRKFVSIDEINNYNSVFNNFLSDDGGNYGGKYRYRTLTETLNDLTNGISLNETNRQSSHVIEGFSLPSITIAKGDDTGRDYHNSNTFVKLNSQEFSDNYFESKKCGYAGGVGSISLFGSNEIIGSRIATMSSVYDFAGNIGNKDKYFKDCVYDPINRNPNLKNFKTQVFSGINDNIMNINDILARFSTDINNVNNTTYVIGNILKKHNNYIANEYFNRINDKSEEQYTILIKKVNNEKDPDYDIKYKSRKLEIYNKVYGYKTKLNEFFERIETQYKQNNNVIGTMTISDTTIQELREIINYLRVVKMSKDIIDIVTTYNIDKEGSTPNQNNNVKPMFKDLKIYESDLDKSYNTPDEQRYLWGISYYYNNATT
jgi:hypothetical protein